MNTPWLTKTEAAAYAMVHEETISRAVNRGRLRYGRTGRKLRFLRAWIDAWIMFNGAPELRKKALELQRVEPFI